MRDYVFTEMTQAEAEIVAAWHYEPPFDFYDFEADPDDYVEILDPVRRRGDYHSVHVGGELVGFFSFRPHDDGLELGLGLRPDLAGNGTGLEFVEAGMAFGREKFAPTALWLDVATWNERAKKVYERAGFEPGHVWTHQSRRGPVEFLRMTRSA